MSSKAQRHARNSSIARGMKQVRDFSRIGSSFPKDYKSFLKPVTEITVLKCSGSKIKLSAQAFVSEVSMRPGIPDMNAIQSGYHGRQNRKYS